jgi:hypothetical protein
MRRLPSARVASLGVTQTKLAVERELAWLFREQPEDYGIDAHVEIVEGETVSGKLLALQIKGGKSWFSEPAPDGWWYRPDAGHVRYWTNHSLPVVVVLYQPETERCHWQLVNQDALVATSTGGWKLLVPEAQVLDESALVPLQEAAQGDPYVLRIRDLQLARPWIDMLAGGARLVIDMEEWINKTSGRGSITLGVDNEDGNDPTPLATWGVFLGTSRYSDVVPQLFAWADVSPHKETYDGADREQFEDECVTHDEGDRFETMDYRAWMAGRGLPDLRPYENVDGEVDYWRLELTLNELGKAFVVVDQFAMTGERQLSA